MQYHKPRMRKVRILATLGPASDTPEMIEKLFRAGADAFRVNMSHGEQAEKAKLIANIRALEKSYNRPTTILVDLQGPKLRVGTFAGGKVELKTADAFRLDTSKKAGDATRVHLPHPEIFAALEIGTRLLLDDGKVVLRVTDISPDHIDTSVEVGGMLSDRKGLNVPDVVVPIAALTDKDRSDLAFALEQGVDWVAMSFVQRPEDVAEGKKLIGGKAALLAKIEKPQAIARLDEIIEMLHENGIGVDLATATASPPAWLTKQHPDMLPVTAAGVRLSHGGRQGYCVSSPIYKAKAAALATQLAKRYSKHPAIRMWHINNEFGCHNALCFCSISADAFRVWLQRKYSSLDELNLAWGTNFWSQRYHNWDEIEPPRQTPEGTYPNPTQMLDYRRFSSDQILELYVSERDAVRAFDDVHPITTNFMSMKHSLNVDYWRMAQEVDFVSTDHYLIAEDPENYIDLAFQADLTRGFAGGKQWLLMEHSLKVIGQAKPDRTVIMRHRVGEVLQGLGGG